VKTKIAFNLNNEDGYFLILATLMILVLLTILGVAASRTSNTEIMVSANEMVYQRNFYMAEGALIEAIDILANSTDLADNPPDWFEPDAGNLTEANVDTYWDTTAEESSVDDTGNTRFLAGVEGYGGGGSLDVDKPTVKAIGVYGRCQRNGVTTIKVGYLKVY
jgi:Tfp pilus assembly protein PilX